MRSTPTTLEPEGSSPDAPPMPAAPRLRRLAPYAAGALLVAGLAGWWANRRAETRALLSLPAVERRALYERTLETLQSEACDAREGASGLREYCREQAEFIVRFPECDRACSELVKRTRLPSPAR
jgi:hypothetical protein